MNYDLVVVVYSDSIGHILWYKVGNTTDESSIVFRHILPIYDYVVSVLSHYTPKIRWKSRWS